MTAPCPPLTLEARVAYLECYAAALERELHDFVTTARRLSVLAGFGDPEPVPADAPATPPAPAPAPASYTGTVAGGLRLVKGGAA